MNENEDRKLHILVDYENVGSCGLIGSDMLCTNDIVTIFYNSSNVSIERQYINAIKRQAGGFSIVKLIRSGKNALDFYIAVMVGQIILDNPHNIILIVSKDKGFRVINDYCTKYTDLKSGVYISDNIEAGIVACENDTLRRRMIIERRTRLSIEAEFKSYMLLKERQNNITTVLTGTEYETLSSDIVSITEPCTSSREIYLSMLKRFGRDSGCRIYRIIKEAIYFT